MKILVVDDEPGIQLALKIMLERKGHDVSVAEDGLRAIAAFELEKPDLVILDAMMPRLNGFDACGVIRDISPDAPILFLSAKGDIDAKRQGFESGADDYLVKPFCEEELMLRVEALLRRSKRAECLKESRLDDAVRSIGDLRIDLRRLEVCVGGRLVDLTRREFQVLALLAFEPGQVYSSEEIVEAVWGPDYVEASISIPSYVRHIRQKIEENPGEPKYLQTVMRIGYRLGD